MEYLKIWRIEHWLKNIFIVFGHAVAIVLFFGLHLDVPLIAKAALSLIPACLIASANYILNEILDVIAESFDNPVRLWLGWYALLPAHVLSPPPTSITLAWWFFGALLMTGKRYAEFRFIADKELSGRYRKSFQTYDANKLIIAMITYANLFCFCTGIAMASYPALENLVLVFPMIVLAVIAYFHHAMSETGARLEPEKLLQNKGVVACTLITAIAAVWLLHAHKSKTFEVKKDLKLMQQRW